MTKSRNNDKATLTTGSEREPKVNPRIYVASWSDYNSGRLHGAWIAADQEPEDLYGDIRSMLEASPSPRAEEWGIHDYEGFGPVRLSEYEDLDTVSRVARGIAEHGLAFAHWAAIVGVDSPDSLDRFDDAFLGHAESVKRYAEDLLDDLGYPQALESSLPDLIEPYIRIDVAGFARDLELSGDIATSEGDGGVYIFDPRT